MKFNKPRMIRLKSRLDTTKERISKAEDPSAHMEIKRWQQVNRMGDQLRRFRETAAGIPQGTKGERGSEPVFEEMMTQISPIWGFF